jgi:hypothetical protein
MRKMRLLLSFLTLAAPFVDVNKEKSKPAVLASGLQAWTTAGAEVGWLDPDLLIDTFHRQMEKTPLPAREQPGALPTFRFAARARHPLDALPIAKQPFALLPEPAPGSDLKGMAKLQNLDTLSRFARQVPEVAVYEHSRREPRTEGSPC